jgi:AraC-like DNA-binding protein
VPYHRSTLAATESVIAEHVVLLETSDAWGPEYVSSEPKLIVPLSGYVFVRTQRGEDLLDGASAWTLAPHAPYRMRQRVAQTSVVFTLRDSSIEEWINAQHADRFVGGCAPIASQATAAVHRIAMQSGDTLRTEESLLNAAGLLLPPPWVDANDKHHRSRRSQRALLHAREFLATSFRDNIALSDVARSVSLSPFHLSRLFRARYGVALFAYRERLRLAEAMRCLSRSKRDLSALAHELGYASHSHLSAAFKRALGCTPTQWIVQR